MTIKFDQVLLEHIQGLLKPLLNLSDEERLIYLLDAINWDSSALGITDPTAFTGVVQELSDAVQSLETLIEKDKISIVEVAESLAPLAKAVIDINDLLSHLAISPSAPADALAKITKDLLDSLIDSYLASRHPKLSLILQFLGVFSVKDVPEIKDSNGTVVRAAGQRRHLDFSAIAKAFSDPLGYIRQRYFTDGAGNHRLAVAIADLIGPELAFGLREIGLTAGYGYTTDDMTPAEADSAKHILTIDANIPTGNDNARALLRLVFALSDEANGLGVVAAFSSDLAANVTTPVGKITGEVSGGLEPLVITKDGVAFADSGTGGPVQFKASLGYQTTATPALRFGAEDGLRFEIGEMRVGMSVSSDSQGVDVGGSVDLNKIVLAIQGGGDDGFLANVLPDHPIEMKADMGIEASMRKGIRFRGSSGLEIQLPTHIGVGPLEIQSGLIAIKLSTEKIPVELGLTIKAGLGPLVAVVENMGLKAEFTFPPKGGNLGPLQLDLGFKPPNGVGLSIDTGVVKGGGFLRFNSDKGEYFGALELSIQNTINLKAVGIINTKMPDGSSGFALLILITAEFTPIQLGMGFSLMGVGGLLGLNHSTNIDALKSGVKTGAVSSVLFPEDVVANITRIISDMTTIFPIVESHFIVAPMGKLGWFTPPLITLEMGIILDIPSPTLVIIGVLRCVLPEEKAPILKLQVNFAGGIDFNKGIIWFDASLFDSSILVYTLTGDMALRIGWGDNPLFILSVGGFHPAFHEVPPDLTNMRRLTISLLSGNNPRLVAQSYFAVTSNTVQSGAKVELYAEACGFNVYGFLGYDLLVRFNPFYFIADIYAGLALRSGSSEIAGINVHCELSGPTPWHALGEASLKILFFSVSVGFDQTWGESAPPQVLEPEDVLKLLVDAVTDSRNWKTDIPANTNLSVSVKQIELLPGEIILHPFGALTVSQKIVPLKLTINKFGNKKPAADTLFDISYSAGNTAYEEEQFAPAQFLQLNDAEKLSRKSFENMKSGLRFQGSDATVTSKENIDLDVTYDLFYVNKKKFLTIKAGGIRFLDTVFQIVSQGNAAAKSSYAVSKKKASNAPAKVEVAREGYKVVKVSDMEECEGSVAVATEVEAYEMYDTLIAKKPSLRGNIQVVSMSELH